MKARIVVAAAAIGGLGLGGCASDVARRNASTMVMEIANITGAGGATPVLSDVASDTGSVVNDNIQVTVNIFRKNNNVTSTSALEHVTLERYEIRYFRTDGRNTEGVDVPYRISGPLSTRLHTPTSTGEIEVTVTITAVRHQAKVEPPLRALANFTVSPSSFAGLGGAGILTTIAEVTIHARQLDGDALSATGRVEIVFGNFPG